MIFEVKTSGMRGDACINAISDVDEDDEDGPAPVVPVGIGSGCVGRGMSPDNTGVGSGVGASVVITGVVPGLGNPDTGVANTDAGVGDPDAPRLVPRNLLFNARGFAPIGIVA